MFMWTEKWQGIDHLFGGKGINELKICGGQSKMEMKNDMVVVDF